MLSCAGGSKPAALNQFGQAPVGTSTASCAVAKSGRSVAAPKSVTAIPKHMVSLPKRQAALATAKEKLPIPAHKPSKTPLTECDLTNLTVSDGQVTLTLAPVSPPISPLPPILACVAASLGDISRQLAGADIVLERALEWRDATSSEHQKTLSITVSSTYFGGCSLGLHPLIRFEPWRKDDPLKPQRWHQPRTPSITFEGELDIPIKRTYAWIESFWDFSAAAEREYLITAESCGHRLAGESMGCRTALIRIYPKNEYELTLTIPAAAALSGSILHESTTTEKERTETHSKSLDGRVLTGKRGISTSETEEEKDGKNTLTTQTSTTNTKGTYTHQDSTIHDGDNVTTSHKYTLKNERSSFSKTESETKGPEYYSQQVSVQNSRTENKMGIFKATTTETVDVGLAATPDALMVSAGLSFEKDLELRPAISFTKNGRELDLTKLINKILKMYMDLHKAMEEIRRFKVTVGWSISFDLKFFEGHITGRWGMRNAKTAISASRAGRELFYVFDFKLTVLAFTLTLTIGIEAHLSAFLVDICADLKVSGTLGLDVSITANVANTDGKHALPVKGDGTGKLNAECCVSVNDLEIKPFQAQVTGGFSYEGELKISFSSHPHIDGTLKRLATKGKAVVFHVGWKQTETPDFEIFEGKDLWTGVFPQSDVGVETPVPS